MTLLLKALYKITRFLLTYLGCIYVVLLCAVVKEKFERREYDNITEYVADMRLMLENCYRFNGLNHPISRNGEKLEQMMEQKLLLLSR